MMEQTELLKNLEKSAEAFNNASEKISTIEKEVNALPPKLKSIEDKIPDVSNLATKDDIKVIKDVQDKNQPALDKLIAKQSEINLPGEVKSFNQIFSESLQENMSGFENFIHKKTKSFSFQLKAVGDMGFAANFGTASQSVAVVRPGIIEQPKRKVHIRDIPELPKGTMDGSTFYFVRETGNGEGAIATVVEGTLKAQIDLDLQEASANAEYIAGWLRISKKMLADVKGMTAFLQSRLLEKLLRAEDDQLINGNGTTPNISGITDGGNFTAYNGAAGRNIEELVHAISQLDDEEERDANGILLRPADMYDIFLNKAVGSGEYNLPPGVNLNPTTGQFSLLGVPVYATTAMTANKFIVGDFRLGAMILQREPAVIEFFEQDSINVRENMITVRVEERLAFPIFGDNYFIYGDFGTS